MKRSSTAVSAQLPESVNGKGHCTCMRNLQQTDGTAKQQYMQNLIQLWVSFQAPAKDQKQLSQYVSNRFFKFKTSIGSPDQQVTKCWSQGKWPSTKDWPAWLPFPVARIDRRRSEEFWSLGCHLVWGQKAKNITSLIAQRERHRRRKWEVPDNLPWSRKDKKGPLEKLEEHT